MGPLPGPRCPALAPSAFFFFIDFEQWDLCLSPIKPRGSAFLPLLIQSVPQPPPSPALFFFKPFSLGWGGGGKKKGKKNFPRPCKLVPDGFQPLPGWSDEKREGERLKRRVDGFFSPRPGRGLQPTHQIHLKCKYELPEQMLQHKTETHVRPGGKRARARGGRRGAPGARAPYRPEDPDGRATHRSLRPGHPAPRRQPRWACSCALRTPFHAARPARHRRLWGSRECQILLFFPLSV